MRTYVRRYVAALLAITIATAFIVAINALSAAARTGAGEAVEQQYGRADLAISDLGDPASYVSTARQAGATPGIAAVATNWEAYGDARFPDGPQNISIGSIATEPDLRWQQALKGRLPAAPDEIALSSKRAKEHGVAIGDRLTFEAPGGDRRFIVTGTVDDVDGPLKATAYLPESDFAALGELAFPRDIVMTTNGDAAAAKAALTAAVKDGTVSTGTAYQRQLRLSATQGIDVFQILITIFAGVSLFVGALVIANTFTILLAQRARDLALLRCVGAMRAQIARSVVAEGVLIGVLGSALGVAAGYGVALIGVAVTRHLSPETPMGDPSLSLPSVAIPVVLGVLVTAAAAALPAQRASAQSPLNALHPQDVVELRSRAGALRLAMAGLFLAGGSGGLLLGLSGSLPVGLAGGMLSFIGVLLLTPVLIPGAIRALGPVARRFGLAGRLAHMNSLRNPRRTAATSTALLIGVTLITSVVVGASSISHKVNTSLDRNHPIDLMTTSASAPIPGHVVDELRDVGGIAKVAALPGADATVGKDTLALVGADADALSLVHGNAWLHDLKPDEIVLPGSTDISGDTVTVRIGNQFRELKVLYGAGLGDVAVITRATLDDLAPVTTTRAVWVRASDSADARDVTTAVTAIGRPADLEVDGGLFDRAYILKILSVVLAVTVALLAIAVLIALIGVGNTLSLSVLERVRENSLLRALGLGSFGLRSMLALEALLMATVAAILGVALGTTYAWFGIRTATSGVFTSAPDLTMPWGQIGLIFLTAALAGLAACVLPARRAARIEPAAGLVAD
ncbi:ABC transporter permease [Aeromicrobium panaciterrae]|uniref:ABC transporter permease n=1 Tax=Aeromicrobium panaciterrae TaxID=363861 RepID=UPI0031D7F693